MDKEFTKREMGIQPIDSVLTEIHLPIADIIKLSPEQLTFKNFKSARNGRYLSRKVREKITTAMSAACDRKFVMSDLFNYK